MPFVWLSGLLLCLAAMATRVQGIVEGREVYPPGAYPFQCGLFFGTDFCGCVVVTTQHVITAARCANSPAGSYDVLLGGHDRLTLTSGQPEWFNVSQITRHPDWTPTAGEGWPNDIAVLTLDRIVTGNAYVESAVLPAAGNETDVDFVGQTCHIIGWGQTAGDEGLANVLQEAVMDVMTNAECEPLFPLTPIIGDKICVYDTAMQLKGACIGDEGSALVCHPAGDDTVWTLAGLSSFYRTGCDTRWPSVYTRVSVFRSWIEEVVGGLPLLVRL